MNSNQKQVQQHFLDTEKEVMKKLENSYDRSLKMITDRISKLQFDIGRLKAEYDWLNDDDPEKEKVRSQIQSKIYQKGFQQALQGQIDDILNKLHAQNYTAVSEYLNGCYEDGYIGAMYDLHGQGIPLIMPIDQKAVVRAVRLDSKLSKPLYTRIGEDIGKLKQTITAELSRGIATGMSYGQVAQQIKLKMTGTYNTKGGAYGRALTIARTEGHRIQVQGGMDACNDAKSKGADVVKQWDSTLDGITRPSHRLVDGEIRELDEAFSNGLMFPGDPSGKAAEVVNCRCALLQRARWALDEDELETLKEKAEFFGLDKTENFEDFKKKYLNAAEELTQAENNGIIEETIGKKAETAVVDVYRVGKIDIEKYKCVTEDIQTDEVIITEKQIEHIKENHPNDYERFGRYFKVIVENPDYIIEANRPNTAVILKEIVDNNERFKTILRLKTSSDDPEHKNSIITFMKIDEKEWKRIIKNKKILYKSE